MHPYCSTDYLLCAPQSNLGISVLRNYPPDGRDAWRKSATERKTRNYMKSLTLYRVKILATFFGGLMAAYSHACAQQVEGPTIELSPFVVQAGHGEYLASSTLAGTRINTNLSDVGASITAMTKLILDDTDSLNLNDLLVYAGNTESSGESGNYSGQDGGTSFVFNPQESQRIRGLGAASISRNLFRTSLQWDSYNVSQVEIVRGASSILFGQGSPAGVINVNLVKPNFKDLNEVKLRFDNNGSFRTTFDLNKVLIDDRLAIRLIGLSDDKKFRQAPSFQKDQRLFGAAQWNLSKNLTIRANGERAKIRASRPNLWAPVDGFTDYLNVLGPTTDNNPRQGQTFGDPFSVFPGEGLRPAVGSVQAVSQHDLFLQWGIAFENSGLLAGTNPSVTSFMPILNAASIKANNGVLTSAAYRYWFTKTKNEFWGGQGPGLVPTSLSNYSLFDWKNNNLTGRYSHQDRDFDTFQTAIEYLSTKRNYGIEISYDYQNEDYNTNSEPNRTIRLDVSQYRFDGTPNPNLLRPSISVGPIGNAFETNNTSYKTAQVTSFAKYDFEKDAGWKNFLGKLLGAHTVTLFASRNEIRTVGRNYDENWVGENVALNAGNGLTGNTPYGNSLRGVDALIYLGPPVSGLNDFMISPVSFARGDVLKDGQTYDVRVWDKTTQKWKTYPYGVSYFVSEGTNTRRRTDTTAVVLQSNWWANQVISTIGYRKDKLTDNRDVYGFQPDTLAVDLTSPLTESASGGGEYFSWGVVAKSLRKWNLPLRSRFDVFYNESDNFDPAATGRLDPLGRLIDPPTGTTQDYGIRIDLLDSKVALKVNFYKTASTLNTIDGSNVANTVINYDLRFRELFWTPAIQNGIISPANKAIDAYGAPPEATIKALNANLGTDGIYTYSSIGNTKMVDTTDVSGDGVEYELVVNPTKNWRIMANVSRQKTVQNNSLPGLQAYIAERLPHWESVFNYPANYNQLNSANTFLGSDGFIDTSKYASGGPGYGFSFGKSFQNSVLLPLNTVLDQDGGVVAEQRQWRLNLVTNYTFGRGTFLTGLAVGGAYRWQDASALGYPLIPDAAGSLRQDVKNPYYGPTESNYDAWISYRQKFLKEKIDWKIQLNVRNLFASDDPIPVSIDSFGVPGRHVLPPLTSWSITNSFRF